MADPFQTTQWSVVLSAARGGEKSRAALGRLCEIYWFPVYAFVRRKGLDADAARDLTQAFFAHLLEHDTLRSIDPKLGKFRAFLLASVKNFAANEHQRANALKRRAEDPAFHVDLDLAEARYQPSERLGPDEMFEAKWARTVLDRAIERLQNEHETAGKAELFRRLGAYMTGEEPHYDSLARDLDMTAGALRVTVHRMRRRLGSLLRDEVARTVADEADIDSELRSLLVAAGRGL